MRLFSVRAAWLSGAVVVGLSLAACAGNAMKMHEQSLYTRLSGKPAITAVVNEFIGNVDADKRTNTFFFFANADPRPQGQARRPDLPGHRRPRTYTGKDTKAAH